MFWLWEYNLFTFICIKVILSYIQVRHAQGFHNVEGEKNFEAYKSYDLFDANLTPLGWNQVFANQNDLCHLIRTDIGLCGILRCLQRRRKFQIFCRDWYWCWLICFSIVIICFSSEKHVLVIIILVSFFPHSSSAIFFLTSWWDICGSMTGW